MERLRQWLTQDRLLRLHFLASPFGAGATTYGVTVWRFGRLVTVADVDALAVYAGVGVILYGMTAVVIDLGGQTMFYTIAAILNYVHERKQERNANAVRIVSENSDLAAQVIRENPELTAQVVQENLTLKDQMIRENLALTAQVVRENPELAAQILEQLGRESTRNGE